MYMNRACTTTTHRLRSLLAGLTGLAMAALVLSASAANLCVNSSGSHGCSATIGAAVSMASPGDVIQVWPGVYKEQVVLTKSLSLLSMSPHGVIIWKRASAL